MRYAYNILCGIDTEEIEVVSSHVSHTCIEQSEPLIHKESWIFCGNTCHYICGSLAEAQSSWDRLTNCFSIFFFKERKTTVYCY